MSVTEAEGRVIQRYGNGEERREVRDDNHPATTIIFGMSADRECPDCVQSPPASSSDAGCATVWISVAKA
jgi:hypothetical protein